MYITIILLINKYMRFLETIYFEYVLINNIYLNINTYFYLPFYILSHFLEKLSCFMRKQNINDNDTFLS